MLGKWSNFLANVDTIPVIKPNFRNTKDKKIITRRIRAFKKHEQTRTLRFVVERGFVEDKYRKLVIRYERLETIFKRISLSGCGNGELPNGIREEVAIS